MRELIPRNRLNQIEGFKRIVGGVAFCCQGTGFSRSGVRIQDDRPRQSGVETAVLGVGLFLPCRALETVVSRRLRV